MTGLRLIRRGLWYVVPLVAAVAIGGCGSDEDGLAAYQPANRLGTDPLIVRQVNAGPAKPGKYYAYRDNYYYSQPDERRYVEMSGRPPKGVHVDHVLAFPAFDDKDAKEAGYRQGPDDSKRPSD